MPKTKLGVVLVVDDTEMIRDAMVSELRTSGFQVFHAADGKYALDVLTQLTEPLFALVSDFDMPRMCGDELIRELESRGTACKAYVLVTGHSETHPPIQNLVSQGTKIPLFILNKPFKGPELTTLLESLAAKK